ncbi:MAG: ribosome silencing factor [Terriglobia bacterium]
MVRAAQDRKAVDLDVLDLKDVCSFTDFFVICSGTSTRHIQAIAEAIREELEKSGISPAHVEGRHEAEWVLLDYLDFVVHIFSQRARQFYDLERLWKKAVKIPVGSEERWEK